MFTKPARRSCILCVSRRGEESSRGQLRDDDFLTTNMTMVETVMIMHTEGNSVVDSWRHSDVMNVALTTCKSSLLFKLLDSSCLPFTFGYTTLMISSGTVPFLMNPWAFRKWTLVDQHGMDRGLCLCTCLKLSIDEPLPVTETNRGTSNTLRIYDQLFFYTSFYPPVHTSTLSQARTITADWCLPSLISQPSW